MHKFHHRRDTPLGIDDCVVIFLQVCRAGGVPRTIDGILHGALHTGGRDMKELSQRLTDVGPGGFVGQ